MMNFKKFSELSKSKINSTEPEEMVPLPESDLDRPAIPNLPKDSTKISKPASTKHMMPPKNIEDQKELTVEIYGKIAKMPKGSKASVSYSLLEQEKTPKSKLWYFIIEKNEQNNCSELQIAKYNYETGVELADFVSELKSFYMHKFKDQSDLLESINNINIIGNNKYARICNIPSNAIIDGKKLITIITEQIIYLLSK